MNELMKPLQTKKKLIVGAIITIIVVAIVLAIFYGGYKSAKQKYTEEILVLEAEVDRLSEPVAVYETASKNVDISLINVNIQDIGELATLEYLYTDAGRFEDTAELFGIDIPLSITTKSFIAKWDGTIKAGVDISQVIAEQDALNKKIVIHIPQAKILSHEIQRDSIETLDQQNGLFNPVKVDDVREFDAVSMEAMEQRAIENGILEKAFENAKTIIEKLVNNNAVKDCGYVISFEVIEGQD